MTIRLLEFLKIHLILAENNIPLQMSRVLNCNKSCRNDLPICFFKDSPRVKTGWPLTDRQKCLETECTALHISSFIIPPSIDTGKGCFCVFANRLTSTCIISETL